MDKVIVWLLILPTVALRPPLASLSIQVSIFFGTYDNTFCLFLLVLAESVHQEAQVSSSETFYSSPESLTIVLLSKYIK